MFKRFFTQSWLNFKEQQGAFNLEEYLLLDTGYPLLTMIFYCIIAKYSFNTSDLTSWVIGNAFLLCLNTCVFTLGNTFTIDRYNGRIRNLIVSPYNKTLLILQKSFLPTIMSVFTVIIGLMFGCTAFKITLKASSVPLLFLIIFISMYSISGFCMCISSLGLMADQMHAVLNLSSQFIILFCGANFPTEQFPPCLQIFSLIIPLNRSIKAANMLFISNGQTHISNLLLQELFLGTLYFSISVFFVKFTERISIKHAYFDLF